MAITIRVIRAKQAVAQQRCPARGKAMVSGRAAVTAGRRATRGAAVTAPGTSAPLGGPVRASAAGCPQHFAETEMASHRRRWLRIGDDNISARNVRVCDPVFYAKSLCSMQSRCVLWEVSWSSCRRARGGRVRRWQPMAGSGPRRGRRRGAGARGAMGRYKGVIPGR